MVNSIEILKKALKERYAIPQFNINNLEWTRYVLEECERLKSPVILGVSEGAVKHMGGFNIVYNMVKAVIKDLNITIPVVLHLDHGSSIDSCKKAIDAGFTSVMIDASKHEINENIRITKEVVMYAKERNVSVEAEVGHVGGNEDNIVSGIMYATVEDCIKIKEAGIDSLAPALGSVHGLYIGEAKLNFERMKEVREAINIPLVLHGGTGIADEDIKKSIENGICKVNINTELQVEWAKAVREFLEKDKQVYDPRKIISSGEKGIKSVVENKIGLLNSNNRI
jgi:fructose-bisphosphate aldolase class II